MNPFRLLYLIVAASFFGVLCSELVCRSTSFRDAAGQVCGCGRLIAIANGRGFYQTDLELREGCTVSDLITGENLLRASRNEQIDAVKVDREFSLLRAQFADEESFLKGVRSSGFSIRTLRERIADQVRSLQWLEKQIATEPPPTEKECLNSYEVHLQTLIEPARFRASHIFLAAPADTPPDAVESKRVQIDALAARLAHGETLPQLAAEASEDEATKWRGGDLGFFSRSRMPSEFFEEVEKLSVGRRSKPFRTALGFHIVEMTEIQPSRVLKFDEARGEIMLALATQRRGLIAKRLADMLNAATYIRPE